MGEKLPSMKAGHLVITLMFHVEMTDDNEVVWWIDSPDVPGFYAAAPELVECRRRALEALADEGIDTAGVVEALMADHVGPPHPA